jgi:hypothetical protein
MRLVDHMKGSVWPNVSRSNGFWLQDVKPCRLHIAESMKFQGAKQDIKLRNIINQNVLLANTEPPWLIQKDELGWKSCPQCHSLIDPAKG